jgi:alpha,alpha-trehalose phosphorylase
MTQTEPLRRAWNGQPRRSGGGRGFGRPKQEIVPLPEHLFPPDEWRVIEASWTPEYSDRAETGFALANGYVGIRGTLDEGRPSRSPGTFINGLHETWPIVHAEDAYGFARVGQSIINVPDATTLELFVDDEPLFLPTAIVRDYARVLDMRTGVLERHLVWVTAAGKRITVRSRRLVSLEQRHLAAISFEVIADTPAAIAIVSRVTNRMDANADHPAELSDPRLGRRLDRRVLQGRYVEDSNGRTTLGYEATNSRMTLAIGVQHVVETVTPHRFSTAAAPDHSEAILTASAEPGIPIRIVKYIAYQTSRSIPPRDLASRCDRTLDRALEGGFEPLVTRQRENLDRFWDRADVEVVDVHTPLRVQQAVRWNIFQLCQASWHTEGASIPAKGLTGAGYDEHYFWDTEAYVLPFLAYTEPRIARNILRFRHSMLPKARERAATLGLRGALFPWRTINGEESSALFHAGTAQYHLNADIAHAIRRYVDVRGDMEFLSEAGAEILVETARMWEDLGFYGEDGCFHLHGVTGPDEYTTVVNDNAFTNLMARLNLNYAAAAVRLLEAEEPERYRALCISLSLDPAEIDTWEHAAAAMYIPYDDQRGITPQDDSFLKLERWDLENTPSEKFPLLLHYHPLVIYRRQVLKQADVVMAIFLLGNEFTLEQKKRNFAYYDPLTTGDSSLSASIQSIVASEIGDADVASRYFDDALDAASRYFDHALLMDLADVAGNVSDGVHVASAAGAWMALVFGFGGVRDFDGHLTINPRLPRRFQKLSYSLRFRERQMRSPSGLSARCDVSASIASSSLGEATSSPSYIPTLNTSTVIDPIGHSRCSLQLRVILRRRLMTAQGECLGATFSVD